jgi:hypothetical protein
LKTRVAFDDVRLMTHPPQNKNKRRADESRRATDDITLADPSVLRDLTETGLEQDAAAAGLHRIHREDAGALVRRNDVMDI